MYRTRAALALLCAAGALAGASAPSAAQLPDAPRIQFRDRTLPNGLRVVSAQDRSTPTVMVQAWYRVGPRYDPPGRSGMGHLVEHLMFQGSRSIKPSQLPQMAEDAGWPNFPGSQSSVWMDAIQTYQQVPSGQLETWLWAEADRLAGLAANDSLVQFEKEAIFGELQGERSAGPSTQLLTRVLEESFTIPAYHRLDRGVTTELAQVNTAELQAHVARYFRPDNVVLVVVGDFDPARLDAAVDRYFGPLRRPAEPLPSVPAEEPARTAVRRMTEYGRPAGPSVGLSFPTPPASSPDLTVLRLARIILAGDAQARLLRAVPDSAASGAFAFIPDYAGTGVFAIGMMGRAQATTERLEQAVRAELNRMRTEPVTQAELNRAKLRLSLEMLRGMETNQGKADLLGQATVLGGDPNLVNTTFAAIQAVTPEDVRRVMSRYAAENQFFVMHYLPESARPASGGGQGGNAGSAGAAQERGDR